MSDNTFTFEGFVPQTALQTEAKNDMVALADRLIAERRLPDILSRSSLHILSGAHGTGKTHLWKALVHAVKAKAPDIEVISLNASGLDVRPSLASTFDNLASKQGALVVIDDCDLQNQTTDLLLNVAFGYGRNTVIAIFKEPVVSLPPVLTDGIRSGFNRHLDGDNYRHRMGPTRPAINRKPTP